jgi:hypothetical protein
MVDSLEAEALVLENWKRERTELDAAITVLERKIAARGGSGVASPARSGQVGPDEFFRLSTPEAIKKFLKIVGKPARATTDIIDGLKRGGMTTTYTNVYTALIRLQTKGVVKVGDNWGLDEWYPPATIKLKPVAGNINLDELTSSADEPVEVEELPEIDFGDAKAPGKGRRAAVAEFIRLNGGAATRAEILAGTDVPRGSVGFCLNDKTKFYRGEDGKWRNVVE